MGGREERESPHVQRQAMGGREVSRHIARRRLGREGEK